MPVYEYRCQFHGIFETLGTYQDKGYCPMCGKECLRIPSRIGIVRVHHAPIPDQNDPLRVADRNRMLKDTAFKKALDDYKESQRYSMEVEHA